MNLVLFLNVEDAQLSVDVDASEKKEIGFDRQSRHSPSFSHFLLRHFFLFDFLNKTLVLGFTSEITQSCGFLLITACNLLNAE